MCEAFCRKSRARLRQGIFRQRERASAATRRKAGTQLLSISESISLTCPPLYSKIRSTMIHSMDKTARAIFEGVFVRGFPQDVLRRARSRLFMIEAATSPQDLMNPPSNRLELLRGELSGWWSVRINQQWRIVFQWGAHGAENVRIVDYH